MSVSGKSCRRQPKEISLHVITWLVLFGKNVEVNRLPWVPSLMYPFLTMSDSAPGLYLTLH